MEANDKTEFEIDNSMPEQTKAIHNGFLLPLLMLGILTVIVIASGTYYLGKSSNKPQVQIPIVTSGFVNSSPTTQPSTISDPTANWQIYTNNKLGYLLKYPLNWKLVECPKDCDDKSSDDIGITSPEISCASGYQKFFSIIINKHKFELPKEYSREVINNVTITRHLGPALEGEYVLFKEGTKEIVLNFNPFSIEQPLCDQDKFYLIFNQILSSFKFTN